MTRVTFCCISFGRLYSHYVLRQFIKVPMFRNVTLKCCAEIAALCWSRIRSEVRHYFRNGNDGHQRHDSAEYKYGGGVPDVKRLKSSDGSQRFTLYDLVIRRSFILYNRISVSYLCLSLLYRSLCPPSPLVSLPLRLFTLVTI